MSTIKKWISQGFPINSDLREQIAWVRMNRPLSTDTIIDARKRKITAEAKLKELEFMLRQGQLIRREEVSKLFCNRVMLIRSGLINAHRILSLKLTGRDPREFPGIIKEWAMQLMNWYRTPNHPLLKK